MVHRRSKTKLDERRELYKQQKEAKKLIVDASFNDRLKREVISRSTTDMILSQMTEKFGMVMVGAVPQIENGLVLSNDYGHGALQNDFFGGGI
jgi:hypothetical protein